MICDFFRKGFRERGPIGGGRHLELFYREVEKRFFCILKDEDITEYAPPNLFLLSRFETEFLKPMWELTAGMLESNHPKIAAGLKFLFKNKIALFKKKHLSGTRTRETFEEYKSYRLILLKMPV